MELNGFLTQTSNLASADWSNRYPLYNEQNKALELVEHPKPSSGIMSTLLGGGSKVPKYGEILEDFVVALKETMELNLRTLDANTLNNIVTILTKTREVARVTGLQSMDLITRTENVAFVALRTDPIASATRERAVQAREDAIKLREEAVRLREEVVANPHIKPANTATNSVTTSSSEPVKQLKDENGILRGATY